MKHYYILILTLLLATAQTAAASEAITEKWVKQNYEKQEVQIPMRDGSKLCTAVYRPRAAHGESPILICRTPYGIHPYGKTFSGSLWSSYAPYVAENYIIVLQDVRGRWMSEGDFMHIRPFIHNKKKKQYDEASDTYDTVEWLLRHVKGHNGRVGLTGGSYPGFYAMMGGLSGHPAVKAVVPQAPVTDWFMGDDIHHNGALMLRDAFSFLPGNSLTRRRPTQSMPSRLPSHSIDEYSYYLNIGCLNNLSKLLGDSIQFWTDVMNHPNYDSWWQERCLRQGCKDVKPAVLVVGGLFDAEDFYGACQLYQAIHENSPKTALQIALGPWSHCAWQHVDGNYLGNLRFGSNTGVTCRDDIIFPFLQYYLKGVGSPAKENSQARIFFTGENTWRSFPVWSPREALPLSIYLHSGSSLSTSAPTETQSSSSYISDPAHPVPYINRTLSWRPGDYLTEDQRFAETRPDVLTFKGEPLPQDLTVCGDVSVELHVALTTSDADFIVKVIDKFPDDFSYDDKTDGKGNGQNYLMKGYEMMVRGDVMRGRFRNSFEKPEAFTPGKPETVKFTMQSVAHTFKKGHRIMVQVQSSWFPLVDLNPQQFVNIYKCSTSDFIKSTVTLLHQQDAASKITLRVLK